VRGGEHALAPARILEFQESSDEVVQDAAGILRLDDAVGFPAAEVQPEVAVEAHERRRPGPVERTQLSRQRRAHGSASEPRGHAFRGLARRGREGPADPGHQGATLRSVDRISPSRQPRTEIHIAVQRTGTVIADHDHVRVGEGIDEPVGRPVGGFVDAFDSVAERAAGSAVSPEEVLGAIDVGPDRLHDVGAGVTDRPDEGLRLRLESPQQVVEERLQ
jgi:hypothetical protein